MHIVISAAHSGDITGFPTLVIISIYLESQILREIPFYGTGGLYARYSLEDDGGLRVAFYLIL